MLFLPLNPKFVISQINNIIPANFESSAVNLHDFKEPRSRNLPMDRYRSSPYTFGSDFEHHDRIMQGLCCIGKFLARSQYFLDRC